MAFHFQDTEPWTWWHMRSSKNRERSRSEAKNILVMSGCVDLILSTRWPQRQSDGMWFRLTRNTWEMKFQLQKFWCFRVCELKIGLIRSLIECHWLVLLFDETQADLIPSYKVNNLVVNPHQLKTRCRTCAIYNKYESLLHTRFVLSTRT